MKNTVVNPEAEASRDEKFKLFLVETERLERQWYEMVLRGDAPFQWAPTHLDQIKVLEEMSGLDLASGYLRWLMISSYLAWASDEMVSSWLVEGYGERLGERSGERSGERFEERPTPSETRWSIWGCFQRLMDHHGFTIDDLIEMMGRSLHFDLAYPQRDLSATHERLLEVGEEFRLALAPNREVDKVEV